MRTSKESKNCRYLLRPYKVLNLYINYVIICNKTDEIYVNLNSILTKFLFDFDYPAFQH
jgi:hypothetical protein